MFRRLSLIAAVFFAFGLGPAAAATCGDAETPCKVENGTYHIAVPDIEDRPGVFVFLHGSGGRGSSGVKNTGFVNRVGARGFALLTPSGAERDWSVRDGLSDDDERDDVAFLQSVIADAIARFDLDPDRVILTGFSRGGSMVWDVACAAPDTAAAYAATAGGFWEPMRTTCARAVHLHHSHGFKDPMVPLEGRKGVWRGRAFHQGNILKGIDVWRASGNCMGRADQTDIGDMWIKRWRNCATGSITLRLWDGGHGMPKGWSTDVIDWFEQIKKSG